MPWDSEEAMSMLKKRDEYYFESPASGKAELKKSHIYKTRNRYESNNNDPLKWKHIVIARERDEGGVTAYVNSRSVTGNALLAENIQGVKITERYLVGHIGKTGDHGIAASVAKLESLNPLKNEVLRLDVEGPSAFKGVLDWYSGLREFPN